MAANLKTDDIDNQTGSIVFGPGIRADYAANLNYAYDELGQLIRDNQENIEQINWRVDGKISDIYRVNGTSGKELSFVYDATGNRVAKKVLTSSGSWIETEYYVRDAQGNVMAIYKKDIRNDQMNFNLTEQHIYGSARLGVDRRNVDMIAAGTPSDIVTLIMKRGEKNYELSNHLGNVLMMISDKKLAVMNGADLSYYRADVVSYSDYYPFGAPMTERTASVTDVRYGFNGKEVDGEISGNGNSYDFGARTYDARLGRWWSVDPEFMRYPYSSTYVAFANSSLFYVDKDGGHNIVYLVVLPGANSKRLNKKFYKEVARQSTENFAKMGLATEVRVFEGKPEDFKINNLDPTDAVYVAGGSAKEVYDYAHKELDPVGADLIMQKGKDDEWKGGMNPERTENWNETHPDGSAKYGGDLAFFDVSELEDVTKKALKLGDDMVQGLALMINHAGGHSAGMNHCKFIEFSKNRSYIMDEGDGLRDRIKNGGLSWVLDPKNNVDYLKAMKGRFDTDGKAKDNYNENDKKKNR